MSEHQRQDELSWTKFRAVVVAAQKRMDKIINDIDNLGNEKAIDDFVQDFKDAMLQLAKELDSHNDAD